MKRVWKWVERYATIKHTNTPWKYEGVHLSHRDDSGCLVVHVDEPFKLFSIQQVVKRSDGSTVTTFIADVLRCGGMDDETLEGNASYIVNAVNNFERNLKTIKEQAAHIALLKKQNKKLQKKITKDDEMFKWALKRLSWWQPGVTPKPEQKENSPHKSPELWYEERYGW